MSVKVPLNRSAAVEHLHDAERSLVAEIEEAEHLIRRYTANKDDAEIDLADVRAALAILEDKG